MDGNTAMVILLVAYGIYLGWCRWLDHLDRKNDKE